MPQSNFLLDQPLGIFLELEKAVYSGSFAGVDPARQDAHKFTVIDRAQIEGYPILLASYVDTAGEVHKAISIKGLFGGAAGIPSAANVGQAASAVAHHIIPLPSTVHNREVRKLLDRWLVHQNHEIDTVVGHSGGGRFVELFTRHLQDRERAVCGITLNSQLPPKNPAIFNFRLDNDPLTNDMSRRFCGSRAYTVGEGGHGLDGFEHYGHSSIREILEKNGVELEAEQALASVQRKSAEIQQSFGTDDPPTDAELRKVEELQSELHEACEIKRRHQELIQGVVMAAEVGSAIATGLENWQRAQTASMEESFLRQQERVQGERAAELDEMRAESAASRHTYFQTSRWASQQLQTRERELSEEMSRLRRNLREWKRLQARLRTRRDAAIQAREAELKKEIAASKRSISKTLQGVATACDVTGMFMTAATTINPFFAIGTGLSHLAGSSMRAWAASADDGTKRAELTSRAGAGHLQHEVDSLAVRQRDAAARVEAHEEAMLQGLSRIAESRDLPPALCREALRKKVSFWEEKLREHNARKEDLMKVYLRDYQTLWYPAVYRCAARTDTYNKRGYFMREGYVQTPEGGAWQDQHDLLARTIRDEKRKLQQEESVADIRDRGHRVAEYWGSVWGSSPEDANQVAKALRENILGYSRATAAEREAMHRSLMALEELTALMGDPRLQKAAVIGRDAYTMADLSRYAYTTALPNLFDARKKEGRFLENIGGAAELLSKYVLPTLQFAVCGIRIIQLLRSGELPPSKAQVRTRQLQGLSDQIRALHDSVSVLHQRLGRQEAALAAGFEQTLHSLRELEREVEQRAQGFQVIEERLDRDEYDMATVARKKRRGELGEALAGKKLEKRVALLLDQAQELGADVQSGVPLADGPAPLQEASYVPHLYLNPGHHTGTLASAIAGRNRLMPNLHHFLQLVCNYRETCEMLRSDTDRRTREQLAQVRRILFAKGQELHGLMGQYSIACEQAAGAQKELIAHLAERMNGVLTKEEASRLGQAEENAQAIRRAHAGAARFGLLRRAHAGAARFGLSSVFANGTNAKFAEDPQEIAQFSFSKAKAGGLDLLFAKFFKSEETAAQGAGAGAVTPSDSSELQEYRRVLAPRTGRVSRLHFSEAEPNQAAWVYATAGRLDQIFLKRALFRPFPWLFLQEVYGARNRHRTFEVLKLKTGPHPHEVHAEIGADLQGKLTLAEIAQLPVVHANPGASQGLLVRFYSVADGLRAVDVPNGLFGEGEWLCSSSPGFLPLAFPREQLACFEKEKRKFAAEGMELSPKYSFGIGQDGKYELTVQLWVNGQKHSSWTVARFDELSVRSFGAPAVNERGLYHEPADLNEFLISAMYSGFEEGVGMPGKNTVTLRGGALIAPVDAPFPGVFQLLKKGFTNGTPSRIEFDSTTYEGDADAVLGQPIIYQDHAPRLGGDDSVQPLFDEYQKRYQVLKAMLALHKNVSIEKLNELLEARNLLVSPESLEEVYEQMATMPNLPQVQQFPVEEALGDLFGPELPMSVSQAALLQALDILNPGGGAGAGVADSADGKAEAPD